jgi:hypothetical protein
MNTSKIVISKILSVDGMSSYLICKFHSSEMCMVTVYRTSNCTRTWSTWPKGDPTKLFLDSLEFQYKHNVSNPMNVSRVHLRKPDSRSARTEIHSLSRYTQFRLPARTILIMHPLLSQMNPCLFHVLMIIHKHFGPHFRYCAPSQLLRITLSKMVFYQSTGKVWIYKKNPYIKPFGFVLHSDDAENLVCCCYLWIRLLTV